MVCATPYTECDRDKPMGIVARNGAGSATIVGDLLNTNA